MGELFDDHHGVEKSRAGAAPLIGHFDPHDAELEEAGDQLFRHRALAVHVVDERADLLDREVAHALLEHLLLFGENGQRCAWRDFDCLGHVGRLRQRSES